MSYLSESASGFEGGFWQASSLSSVLETVLTYFTHLCGVKNIIKDLSDVTVYYHHHMWKVSQVSFLRCFEYYDNFKSNCFILL